MKIKSRGCVRCCRGATDGKDKGSREGLRPEGIRGGGETIRHVADARAGEGGVVEEERGHLLDALESCGADERVQEGGIARWEEQGEGGGALVDGDPTQFPRAA